MPTPVRGNNRPTTLRGADRSTPTEGARVDAPQGTADAQPVDGVDRGRRPSVTDGARIAPAVRRGPRFDPIALTDGVTLSSHGFTVGRKRSFVDAGVTQTSAGALYAAARQLSVLDKNPFEKLTAKQKQQVGAHLGEFLLYASEYRGRPSVLSVRARAGSYALMVQLAASMSTGREQAAGRKLVDQLLLAATDEPHPGLRKQMRLGLLALPKSMLTATQLRTRKTLAESVAPARPPYEAWFGDAIAKGEQPQLNGKQYVQDEFWRRELANYKKAGFKVEVTHDHHGERQAIVTGTLKDPKGKADDVALRFELVEKDDDVFEAMDDPNLQVVLYTGHSGVGSVAKWSVETAPSQRGDKLVGLFACRTKQNANMVRRQFPDAHVIVSNHGTYGNDDRIAILELLKGIGARNSYEQMQAAVNKGGVWEKDNYFFPHDRRQLKHVDLDGDGKTALSGDRVDLLYHVKVPRGRGERVTMKPSRKDPATLMSSADGGKLADAVSWFNSLHKYWSEEFGWQHEFDMADRFRADGWFTSSDDDEIVRVEEVKVRGQDPIYRVKVNAAYADQSDHALAMMVTWALNEELSKDTRPDEKDYDRHLRGLAFVSSYVANLVEFADLGDNLLRNFAKRFGYPQGMTYEVAYNAVYSDHDFEASPKVLKALEKGLQYPFLEVNPNRSSVAFRTYVQQALDALKKSGTEIGWMTFEAIATGKVEIDELTDLSREDFHHVRKEFLREGLKLDPDDWYRIGTKNSRAHRAITQSMDGYMWDNRVYVAKGLSPRALAATLVHEVNHILNRSEENYRGDAAIFREEYRAFYSEALFREEPVDDPAFCRRLKAHVIELYALRGVSPDDLPDVPPGKFAPEPGETWGA
jgi:hypothetical protein